MPTKAVQIVSSVLLCCLLISSTQKVNYIAAENHIVTESSKGLSPSDTEKTGPGFGKACPRCLCHSNTKQYIVYIFFSVKHKRQEVLSHKSHASRSKSIYRIAFSSSED